MKEVLEFLKKIPNWAKVTIVFIVAILYFGEPYFDRYLDYREAVDLTRPRRVIEKTKVDEIDFKDYSATFDNNKSTGAK